MAMGLACGQMVVELVEVDPDASAGIEADLLAVNVQPGTGEGLPEGVEGSTECGPAAAAVVLGPQQVDQRITPVSFSSDGEVGQEGDGLTCVHLERDAIALDAGWA
jgi:hypothetical protein